MIKRGILPIVPAMVLSCFATASTAADFIVYPDGNREVISDLHDGPLDGGSTRGTRQTSDSNLYVQYDSAYETAHYECWGTTGRSDQWQGVTAPDVANAAVVRRGRTMYLVSDSVIDDPTQLRIFGPAPPGHDRPVFSNWTVSDSGERLSVDIPADAPVGDYRFEYGADHCTVYVVFDVYTNLSALGTRKFETWAYNDDPYSSGDMDYLNYFAYGPGPSANWSGTDSTRLYLYRGGEANRQDGVFGERLVELAASVHGWGAENPMEASRHLYSVVGQRMVWTSSGSFPGLSQGYVNTFDRVFNGEGVQVSGTVYTANELTVDVAEKAALGRGRVNHLPDEYVIPFGQCMNFASTTGALARAIGIPSRPSYTVGTTAWTQSFHVWSEMYLGTTALDYPGWETGWWKFDSADERREEVATHAEGSITSPRMDGWSDFVHNVLNLDDCDIQGGQFLSRYDRNLTRCDDGANHTVILLKSNADRPPVPPNSMIWNSYRDPNCPWMVVDNWSTVFGTGESGVDWVETEAGGYALNLLMNTAGGGVPLVVNNSTEDDLPVLGEGIETPGIIGGLGSNFYLVDVSDGAPVTVHLPKGQVSEGFGVRLYGSIDAIPHVRALTPAGQFVSQNGSLEVPAIPANASFLCVMAVGEDDELARFDNQVWHEYSLLLERSATPSVSFLNPRNGAVVSNVVEIEAVIAADDVVLEIDGVPVQPRSFTDNGTTTVSYSWDTRGLKPWSRHRITLSGARNGIPVSRFLDITVREPEIVFFEGFEAAGANAWSLTKSSGETSGGWIIASPREATESAPPFSVTQPGAPADGLQCLFSGRNLGGDAANDDIDSGAVIATLHDIPIGGYGDLFLSYDLWWYNRDVGEDSGDFFRAEISTNSGETWQEVHEITYTEASTEWENFNFDISNIANGNSKLSIRFTASDGTATGNLLEAAIDNVTLTGNEPTNLSEYFLIY